MLRIALSTFALVFLAELGDKTQLAVIAMASRSQSPWAVFAGAAGALVVSALLAVLLGYSLSRFVPESATRILHYIAGAAFILVGIWTIWKA